MADTHAVESDERTVAVENASYVLGYKVMAYAILVDVVLRSFAFREAAWDLFAVVILAGLVVTAYQWRASILTNRWVKLVALAFAIALAIAIVIAAETFRRGG